MVVLLLLLRAFALVSLAILAAGATLLVDGWDRWQSAREVYGAGAADVRSWWPMALGIGLLLWSVAGRLVILLLLGRPGSDSGRRRRTGERLEVTGADGSRLAVEAYGPRGAPVVLFTHGWGLDSTMFYEAKQVLAERYRVVVWDLPGLGASTPPEDGHYRIERLADDLAAVAAATAPANILLAGHSIGGMIVQTFARLHPDRLGGRLVGAVLMNTTYVNPLLTTLGAPAWEPLRRPVLEPMMRLDIWLNPIAWLVNWQSYFSGSTHVAFRLAGFGHRPTRAQLDQAAYLSARHAPKIQARGNFAMFRWAAGPGGAAAGLPELVVAGGRDVVTLPSASEHIAQRDEARLVQVAKAGHLGPMECAEEYNAALLAFADKVFAGPQARGEPPIGVTPGSTDSARPPA